MNATTLVWHVLISLCVLGMMPLNANAGSATSAFRVTATLDPTCTIQTTPMIFGHYNSLTAHASAPLDINGTVTITCSKGMATTIALDRGDYAAQAIGTTRAMKLVSADEYLNYELYQDVVRTTLWGSAGETIFVPAVAPDTHPRTFFIYGRIPPAQNVASGEYLDTVIAIVNF
jgi:spore coat protein U-like protein